jgi:murein L,D-transpeptidase YcbB/YkuD
LVWIAPDTVKTHATDAMLLLDCVNQYGLNHADYHPDKLLYDELRALKSGTAGLSNERKVLFDIWLTDAMLAFENNLHYGRFNPAYPANKIDANEGEVFNSVAMLNAALKSKEFMKSITLVQPTSKIYYDLKHMMYQQTGLYTGDCYEFPEAGIRRMAINMERLRWYSGEKTLMEINIPSSILTVHLPDSDANFRLKMSKATLLALAKQLGSATLMKISVVNDQTILHIKPAIGKGLQELNDMPLVKHATDQPLQITVLKSKKLADLLLHRNLKRASSIPVKLTYITCEPKGGALINYKDIYGLDNSLMLTLYHTATKPD